MFYLKEFFKLIKENFIVGILFIASTSALVVVSWHQEKISIIISSAQKSISTPYFNALITDRSNLLSVVRKMKSLPGVLEVSFQGDKELKKEVSSLKASFGDHVLEGFSAESFKNMRIELESGIQAKSQSLIREYLTRLIGEDNVTMSQVKTPQIKKNHETTFMTLITKWGNKYLLLLVSFFWMFCLFLFLKPLKTYAFIIEKFQRKVAVAPKVILSGVGLFVATAALINYLFFYDFKIGPTAFVVPVLMFFVTFVFSASFNKGRVIIR